MKFRRILHIALFSTVLTPFAHAEMATSTSPASPHQLSVGVEGYYYGYDEKYTKKHIMDFRGALLGVTATYNYNFVNHFFMGADFRLAFGKANYRGGITDLEKKTTKPATSKGIINSLLETRLLVGKKYMTGNGLRISPYTGVGYRLKSDFSSRNLFITHDSTVSGRGYNRASQYFYVPFGLTVTKELNQEWSVAATGEYDLFILGKQWSGTAHFHTQRHGYGLKADVSVAKRINNKSISFGPFIYYWNVKNSNVIRDRRGHYWIEPKNTTVEAGLQLKFRF